ncbi:MAG: hypothetical protein GF364_04620 [Candidatus Lokiarchaeota archaeon]|nr:hypothetical protein [Candidatus Lokiarchaeota archaeon]
MSEMINDTLQNVYNRLSQMGKNISALQSKIEELNKNLDTRVNKLSNTITSMAENSKKEGEAFKFILDNIGKKFLSEIEKLQSDIGLKDLTELINKLKEIAKASEETLQPEYVSSILAEVLDGVKGLTGTLKEGGEGGEEGEA